MSTNVGKNSFSRFDDILCQNILSYLSLEDRLRTECVCHRWKRTVWKGVDRIELTSKDEFTKKLISSKTRKPLNCEALGSVLKKCPNIRHIEMDMDYSLIPVLGTDYRNVHLMDEVYDLFLKHCPHLSSFKSSYIWLSREMCHKFNQFFGPKLEYFGQTYKSYDFLREDFQHFKNLKSLDLSLPSNLQTDPISVIPSKELTHLFVKYEESGQEIVVSLIRDNPSLKYIEISEYGSRPSKTDHLITDLMKLSQLVSLKLSWYTHNTCDNIWLSFKGLGQSCVNLKRLTMANYGLELQFPQKILKMMKYFPRLTRLKLIDNTWCGDVTVLNGHTIICGHTSCESLKDCQNLTHLSLRLNRLKDYFFTDIDKHLPKLVSLKITNSEVTNAVGDSIGGLQQLTVLCFKQKRKMFDITHSYSTLSYITSHKLFKSCPKLRLIKINYPKDEYIYYRFHRSFRLIHEHGKKRR